MLTLRLQGLTRKYWLVIDDREVRLNAPNVLSTVWEIPRAEVSWIGDEDPPPDTDPAVAPRILPLVTNRSFGLNLALFFTRPQRVVPRTKKTVGPMPFSVEESIQGVWADGVMVTVLKRKRAMAELRDTDLIRFGSLPEAVARTYGTVEQPLLDGSHVQPPVDAQGEWSLTVEGAFWHRPEPVARTAHYS